MPFASNSATSRAFSAFNSEDGSRLTMEPVTGNQGVQMIEIQITKFHD